MNRRPCLADLEEITSQLTLRDPLFPYSSNIGNRTYSILSNYVLGDDVGMRLAETVKWLHRRTKLSATVVVVEESFGS